MNIQISMCHSALSMFENNIELGGGNFLKRSRTGKFFSESVKYPNYFCPRL